MIENDQLMDLAVHANSAERMLLAVALVAPHRIPEILAQVDDHHWETPRHIRLWQLMCHMWRSSKPITVFTVIDEVIRMNVAGKEPDEVAYVSELPGYLPASNVNVAVYADSMIERYQRRMMRHTAGILNELSAGHLRVATASVLDEARRAIGELQAALSDRAAERYLTTVYDSIVAGIDQRKEAQETGKALRIPTGLIGPDKRLGGGLARQEVTILMARPSMGKSALAQTMAMHQAQPTVEKPAYRVGIYSLEMARAMLGNRSWASGASIDLRTVADGAHDDNTDSRHWLEVNRPWLQEMQVYDGPRLHIDQLVAQLHMWHARGGLDIAYVDYLTLIRHRAGDRNDLRVGETVAILKDVAIELDIAMVILAQLNRGNAKNRPLDGFQWPDRGTGWVVMVRRMIPQAHDLKDSGEVEQHADLIMSVTRAGSPVLGMRCEIDGQEGHMDISACIDICKNRNGILGTDEVWWDGPTTTFWDEEDMIVSVQALYNDLV